jgi:hypothetical protein
MPQNENPWANTANQAVGALYKHYMSKPNPAEQQKIQLQNEVNNAKLRNYDLKNAEMSRLQELGDYGLDLPAPIRNHMYRGSLDSPTAQVFDSYVRPNIQVDTGDTKQIVSGVTARPIEEYGVGIAPESKIDTAGGRVITTEGVPMGNRPSSVSDALMQALVQQESGGDPMALSPVGAGGLTQIMPDTARDPGYGVQPLQGWDGIDPRTAPEEEQMRFGRDYLEAMKRVNGGDEALALAAYNAGQGKVEKYGGIPPYEETQNYVEKIGSQVPLQTGGTTVTPLPESPVNERASEERDRLKNIQSDIVTNDIDRALMTVAGTAPVTGIPGTIMKKIPGTDSHDFGEILDGIKANIGFDKLQAMREASPTGGALGQVSEFENRLLQAVYGSLAQSQSEPQLRYNLMRLKDTYNDIVHGEGNGPERFGVPTIADIQGAQSAQDLEGVFNFFEGDLPDDIEQAVSLRANQLGL